MYKSNSKFLTHNPRFYSGIGRLKGGSVNPSFKFRKKNYREGKLIKGNVGMEINGGYLIYSRWGTGFCPYSHMYPNRPSYSELQMLKKHSLEYLIIEKTASGVVVSRRNVIEQRVWDKIIGSFSKGKTIRGLVKSVVEYGAFVDLGCIDGLLHVSRLGPDRRENEAFLGFLEKGKVLEVVVADIDEEYARISLALGGSSPSLSISGKQPWWLVP